MTPAFSLAGKTALVTGGGQGVGAAIMTRFAEAGARVVAAKRTVEQARALAASLVKRGLDVAAEPFGDISRAGLTKLIGRVAARPIRD